MDKKKEDELHFAQCFAKSYFPDNSFHVKNSDDETIDILATSADGIMAWELTRIATNQEGFKRKSYLELLVSDLQVRLREYGIKELLFCITFQANIQNKYPKRSKAVLELSEFIVRNSPNNLAISQSHDFEIPYAEKVNYIVESIGAFNIGPGNETDVCQAGAFWAGGLPKEEVQKIIDGKNRLLTQKRRLHPDKPHWLIMVIENNEGSCAAFWEKLANESFKCDYDACFIFERLTNKYIRLNREQA